MRLSLDFGGICAKAWVFTRHLKEAELGFSGGYLPRRSTEAKWGFCSG